MVTIYFVSDIYCDARKLAAYTSNGGPFIIILEDDKLSWLETNFSWRGKPIAL